MHMVVPPSYRCLMSDLALIGQAVSEKKIFEYYGDIHAYYPGVGQTSPLGIINPQSISPFPYFFSANDILTIFQIQIYGRPMLTLS